MNFTKAARTAAIATAATLNAIAILALYPKDRREQEIARAKRNIAERKAQIATRRHPAPIAPTAPAETDNPIAAAPTPAPAAKTAPAPALPDPWTTAPIAPIAPTPAPAPILPPATKPQLCLPPAPEPAPTAPAPKPKRAIAPKKLSRLTTRELKAIAAKRKIRGAAKMNKSELIAALA
jgi:Rho termination factor, N-terminal domain